MFVGLIVAVVVIALISASLGQYRIGFGSIVDSVLHKFSGPLHLGHPIRDRFAEQTLWQIRMPRVVMSLLVGAVLGSAGAVMQGIFGNPLAEPAVIGVSYGAAVGACMVIVFGWTFLGSFTIAVAAFVTALIATMIVYFLSRSGRPHRSRHAGADGHRRERRRRRRVIAYMVFLGDTAGREQIVFWQLGSLNGTPVGAGRRPSRRWSRSGWSARSLWPGASTCSRSVSAPRATSA